MLHREKRLLYQTYDAVTEFETELRRHLASWVRVTLLKSHGDIPKSFLRGCGMPDGWIDYLPSLIGMLDPWQLYSCFLSHSTKDQSFADKLYHAMIEAKVRVWYAPEDMRGGRKSYEQIDQAIRHHDKLLIVLSPHSIDSEWVRTELRWARKKEIDTGKARLVPDTAYEHGRHPRVDLFRRRHRQGSGG